MPISELVLCTSRLGLLNAGREVGTASGFFYTVEDRLLLVTNRHVVRGEGLSTPPDAIRLRLHLDATDMRKNDDYTVPLYAADGNQLWKEHPVNSDADIAVIPLRRDDLTGRFIVKALTSDNFLPDQYVLDLAEDVFVMGYPRGFYDHVANLPVFRNAMIASVYGVNFRGLPCFLTDANLHPGTSGSPVITKPKSTWRTKEGGTALIAGTSYYLLGVHSGTYQISLPDGTPDPLGLGVAWYASLIEEAAS